MSKGQEKMDVFAQKESGNPMFLCLFVLFRPSMNRMLSTHTVEGRPLLSQLNPVVTSARDALTDTPTNRVSAAL